MKKLKKLLVKLFWIALAANVGLFLVFFFDLDGKLLFNVVEPFLKNHYDNMERRDMTKMAYGIHDFPKYSYDS
jgi:hypothetical protein